MHGEYVITVMYYYCVNKFHESVHTFIHHILNSPNTGSQKANKNRPQNDYILHTFTCHLYRCIVRILNQIIDNYLILIYL